MTREFVHLPTFEKWWTDLSLDDDALRVLEDLLLQNPEAGDLIPGSGGLRKVRFALPGGGRSKGARVLYVDFAYYNKIYLVNIYSKSDISNISNEQANEYRKLIDELKGIAKTRER